MTMNTDKDNLQLENLGLSRKTPFTVPKGYFDTLSNRIMENIDAEEQQTDKTAKTLNTRNRRKELLTYISRWMTAAAACIVAVFVGIHFLNPKTDTLAQVQSTIEEYDDEFGEDLMSYSMMGEQDIYCYLSGME